MFHGVEVYCYEITQSCDSGVKKFHRKSVDLKEFHHLLKIAESDCTSPKGFKSLKNSKLNITTITAPEELADAEILWITAAQQLIVHNKEFNFQLGQFNLFKDDVAEEDSPMQKFRTLPNI